MNNFEILHFRVGRGGNNHQQKGYFCRVTRMRGDRKHYRIGFSMDTSNAITSKGLTHFQLHVERFTGSVFFVFINGDDSTDARIGKEKGGQVRICNAKLVDYLAKKMNLDGDFQSVLIELSRDLANDDNYATFRINFPTNN